MFVKWAAVLGGVKDETIQALFLRPIDDLLHEESSHAAPAPFRFSEDIQDDGVAAIGDGDLAIRIGEGMRQGLSQLNTSAANDFIRRIFRAREPADIFTARQGMMETVARFGAKFLEDVVGDITHVLEHPRSMPGNDVGIGSSGEANMKLFRHDERSVSISRPEVANGTTQVAALRPLPH